MKLIITILICLCTFSNAEKIASIDMNKTFLDYYKTIKSEMKMREQLKIIEERATEMKQTYDNNIKEYKKLNQESSDISFSKEKRAQKKEEGELKKREILILENNMKGFNIDAKKMMRKQHNDSRASILKEIQDVVKTISEKNDYDMVLDSSGKTANQIPAIISSSNKFDITEETLKVLNKGQEQFIQDWKMKKSKRPAKKAP
jgi:Skp family chaperone for outer membrane proteins